ncbi:MAG: hypothetical protein ABWX56_08325 [Mycetocola sp.]
MTCDPLATTGFDPNITLLLALAVIGVVTGLMLLIRQRAVAATVLALLFFGGGAMVAPAVPAQAIPSTCAAGDNLFTVTQLSTMVDLAPGVAPVPIVGSVVNVTNDDIYISAVRVEITSVSAAPGAPQGVCDASDYVITGSAMSVNQELKPGGSSRFSGASIGFANKAINQDGCKRATVHLLYTTNPSD